MKAQVGEGSEPRLPHHCTMLHDEQHTNKDYEECWDELINKQRYNVINQDNYIGPQEAASAVTLSLQLQQWFQVPNSARDFVYF